ncbi:MAG: ATP-binding protein [Chloroflexota bacterium]
MTDKGADAHGPLPEGAICPKCLGLRIDTEEVRAIVKARMAAFGFKATGRRCHCEEEPERTWQQRRQHYANLPHEGSPRTFRTFVRVHGSEEAIDAAKEFAESDGPPHLLVLVGQVGSGKSHLLEAMARRRVKRGYLTRYEYIPELLDRLRSTFGDRERPGEYLPASPYELFEQYSRVETLILDDLGADKPLGKESASEWAAGQITNLVDRRCRQGERLALGTNLVMEQRKDKHGNPMKGEPLGVAEAYGWRLASRLWDKTGDVRLVTMTCGDFRRRGLEG